VSGAVDFALIAASLVAQGVSVGGLVVLWPGAPLCWSRAPEAGGPGPVGQTLGEDVQHGRVRRARTGYSCNAAARGGEK
jgi:hypothetical protein